MDAIVLPDEKACELWASLLAQCLLPPAVLTFSGDIGAGKTTFIRAMLRALGISSAIKSPTFSLVESYACQHLQVHHFDLYRIQDEIELDYTGFRDYFTDTAVVCIEWPERVPAGLYQADIHFSLLVEGSGRLMSVHSLTTRGEKILSCITDKS